MNDLLLIGTTAIVTALAVLLATRLRARVEGRIHAPSSQSTAPAVAGERGNGAEILALMSEGVLLVDDNLRPAFTNPTARRLLGLKETGLPVRLAPAEVANVTRRSLESGAPIAELVEVLYPKRLTLKVQAAPLKEGGALIVLLDVSEEVRTQRIRREFVAHASHELKSPVAGVQALAEALQKALDERDEASSRRFATRLLMEADRLGKLVSDLLDLSRLEDPTRLPEEPCDIADVARREVALLEADAHKSELALTPHIDRELWIRGDSQQVSVLVRNLLQNAIQYTPPGGHISIDVAGAGREAVIRVSDDGIGIPLEAQGRIFERFYRVDRARSRERGGTGLGLAIVKHVAELHGGSVDLSSELGAGSTFTVKLPLLDSAQKDQRTVDPAKETA